MMPTPLPHLVLSVSTAAAVASVAVLGCFVQVVHSASLRGELARAHQRATGEYLPTAALALRGPTSKADKPAARAMLVAQNQRYVGRETP